MKCYGLSLLEDRRARVTARFEAVGVPLTWCSAVPPPAPLAECTAEQRAASCMHGHLGMLHRFLEEGADFGVFCEDDVMLRRDFAASLTAAVELYTQNSVSVLLLSYLLEYRLPPGLHEVWPSLWGSQMYLLGRKAAFRIVRAFHDPSMVQGPFSPDWTITKFPGAYALSPMLAVEEGLPSSHGAQDEFHQKCREAQYDPEIHF